eukprot:SAG22_NODE_2093_length_3020_cov_8.343033_1_plen_481_part_00
MDDTLMPAAGARRAVAPPSPPRAGPASCRAVAPAGTGPLDLDAPTCTAGASGRPGNRSPRSGCQCGGGRCRRRAAPPLSAAGPDWPAALGARVHVAGYGQGTYVRFDPGFVSGHAHTIDFDEGGLKTLSSDSWCLRRLRCCSAVRPVASGWCVVGELGSVQVSTLMAPEPQSIGLAPAMSISELRAEIAQRFGVPPRLQRLVAQPPPAAGHSGAAGGGAAAGHEGHLVGEGCRPSTTVWGSGVRAGMQLLLVSTDPAELCCATRDFEPGPTQPTGLKFDKGEVIEVLARPHKHRWEGRVQGSQPERRGTFPRMFVELLEAAGSAGEVAASRRRLLASEVARVRQAADRFDAGLQPVKLSARPDTRAEHQTDAEELFRTVVGIVFCVLGAKTGFLIGLPIDLWFVSAILGAVLGAMLGCCLAAIPVGAIRAIHRAVLCGLLGGTEEGAVGDKLAAALEGRAFEPVPRTRVWDVAGPEIKYV